MSLLDIKPIKINKVEAPPLNKLLPQHPFRVLCVAPSNSGKTWILLNLIKREIYYKDYFKIYIFSKTAKNDDGAYESINIPEKYVQEELDEGFFNTLKTKISKIPKNKRKRLLFIFDDMVNEMSNTKKGIVSKIFMRGRHEYNASVVVISQGYMSCPKNIRENASNIIALRPSSAEEIEDIGRENSFHLNKKEFKEMYKSVVYGNNPYQFLHICKEKGMPPSLIFRKGFDTIIDWKNGKLIERKAKCKCEKCKTCKGVEDVMEDITDINDGFSDSDCEESSKEQPKDMRQMTFAERYNLFKKKK